MTFKRHYHEDGLTEKVCDFLLPLSDPIIILPATSSAEHKHNEDTRSIRSTRIQTGTAYRTPRSLTLAFNTVEVAEKILLDLPAENLLCKVQLVCRRWHEIVQHNPLIQEYLFFKPLEVQFSLRNVTIAGIPPKAGDASASKEGFSWKEFRANALHNIENPWLYLFSADKIPIPGSWERMLASQPPKSFVGMDPRLSKEAWRENPLHLATHLHSLIDTDPVDWVFSRSWVGEHRKGSQLRRLYAAADWHSWKPLMGWETIQRSKKVVRMDETFLEFEVADDGKNV